MYELQSKVRYSEVDSKARMTWTALLDYFQDCCVFQSEVLDIGVEYLARTHTAWVLSSIQVHYDRQPKLMDSIKIQTWPYGMKSFYGYRNFKVVDEDGGQIAYANSIWVLIDTETGRPVKVPQVMIDRYTMLPQLEMECATRKMTAPADYEEKEAFEVPDYFIDTNNHMNNSKYVLAAKQYLPEDFVFDELRVEYKKAAVAGDMITPRISNEVSQEEQVKTVVLAASDGKPYAIVKFIKSKS